MVARYSECTCICHDILPFDIDCNVLYAGEWNSLFWSDSKTWHWCRISPVSSPRLS